jgi:methylglutamate dehydrogenase subunit C
MADNPFRTASGGQIDRTWPLAFRFAGRWYNGYAGDTLASALLANGVRTVGRSFKYHRPRGVFSIGSEEPNALVTLRKLGLREPNTRATMVELYDWLEADGQQGWPSVRFDIGAVNGWFAPLLAAGFYYKTFMGPLRSSWMWYEARIRAVAGLGKAGREPDLSHYEKAHAHAEVVVIGGGPAGLSAALTAAETGVRVIMIDEAPRLGGWLLRERDSVGDYAGAEWAGEAEARLRAMPNVTVLTRTTAFGLFDGGTVGALERVTDHLGRATPTMPRQRFWQIRPRRIVLASGSIEQPLTFAGNDRPGVMLAGAVRGYLNQYGVICGRRLVVVTDNDDGYRTALDYRAAGLTVETVVDRRRSPPGPPAKAAQEAGIDVMAASQIARTLYGTKLYGVEVARPGRTLQFINCDCLAMCGGWAPALQLSTHLGHRPVFDAAAGIFLPATAPNVDFAGACAGLLALEECLASGREAGRRAAQGADIPPRLAAVPGARKARTVPSVRKGRKAFVDFQNDVTTQDVKLAVREGYVSPEHLKRYTTLGMGTDQGKTSNLAGLTFLSRARGLPAASLGPTTARPPFTPVAIGALAGLKRGQHYAPLRRTPMQAWHEAQGAPIAEAGLWRRPKAYPRTGENIAAAGQREAINVRAAVGITDVSTLGKIEVQGPDAALFLDRIYCNVVASLKVGRARYGVMLREDGIVLDDGTIARLGENRFYITTTTAAAAKVMDHLERYAQVIWPRLRVRLTSVSDQFGAIAIAGPKSRALLERIGGDIDFGDRAFPYPAVRTGHVAGSPARVLRVSYSGEQAYEVHLGAGHARALWEMLLAEGASLGVAPYGTEAMSVLRIEKGHIAGPEIDGRTTPVDLGLSRLVRWEKDFVGKRLLERPALREPNRQSLVGLIPADRNSTLRSGAQLTFEAATPPPAGTLGHITSACFSPHMGHPIALAMLANAEKLLGSTLYARFPLRDETVAVKVVKPVFVDPEGRRLHA